ncbi:DUF3784 domain-containing protein [Halorussus halophilus]|uniref:DUF3784 domain-containing protein n=1 Tax=Halorussus halophilus TaxID=2650975 RepID=UPI0013017788|nr:DUF3784 domain-containing protein [Halorussus halophilus]
MVSGVTEESLATLVFMVVSGLFICYLGYRIRYRTDVRLISGYRSETVADGEGLARLVGGVGGGLGIVTVGYGLAAFVVEPWLWYWVSWTLLLLGGVAFLQRHGKRFAAKK